MRRSGLCHRILDNVFLLGGSSPFYASLLITCLPVPCRISASAVCPCTLRHLRECCTFASTAFFTWRAASALLPGTGGLRDGNATDAVGWRDVSAVVDTYTTLYTFVSTRKTPALDSAFLYRSSHGGTTSRMPGCGTPPPAQARFDLCSHSPYPTCFGTTLSGAICLHQFGGRTRYFAALVALPPSRFCVPQPAFNRPALSFSARILPCRTTFYSGAANDTACWLRCVERGAGRVGRDGITCNVSGCASCRTFCNFMDDAVPLPDFLCAGSGGRTLILFT